jgi:hypothetical protein
MTTRTMHSRPGRLALAATAVATLTVGVSVVANPAAAAKELRLVGATSRTADAASCEGPGFLLDRGGRRLFGINDRGQIVGVSG